jgi:molecular chaperone DnaJ
MPVTDPDYYKALGVSKNADAAEIKKAYKKLAKKYHPDRNADDEQAEQRFKEVSEAYSVLGDEEKRELYDKYGHEGLKEGFDPDAYEQYRANFGGGAGRTGGFEGFESFFRGGGGSHGGVEFDLNDLFGGGGGRAGGFGGRARGRSTAQDLSLTLRVGFEQAIDGFTTSFTYKRPRPCSTCHGTGAVNNNLCPTCRGQGAIEEEKTLTVNVPKGAETGDRLRLKGKGGVGTNGRRGDVYLNIEVGDHPYLRREGLNLVTTAEVKPLELLAGGKVDVPTLKSSVKMSVPAGFDPSERLRIAGKGVTRKGDTGDLLVELKVVGQKLAGEALEQAKELQEIVGSGS